MKGSNHETRTFYFLPEGWKTACKGYDAGAIAKELVARGILEAGSDGKTSKLVKLPGLGPRRCYVIRSDAFAESENCQKSVLRVLPQQKYIGFRGNTGNAHYYRCYRKWQKPSQATQVIPPQTGVTFQSPARSMG